MDLQNRSNWNALSVEAAIQQLNCQDDDTENILPRCNTVRNTSKYINIIIISTH